MLTPQGFKNSYFPCSRKVGYESVVVKLPKNLISNPETGNGLIILQLEVYTYLGVIV